jgi:hypothetical protein
VNHCVTSRFLSYLMYLNSLDLYLSGTLLNSLELSISPSREIFFSLVNFLSLSWDSYVNSPISLGTHT